MKIRNPKSRFHLQIKKSDKVLEVGGGHNPHPRSNVVVDKFTGDDNQHRGADLKVLSHQQFLEADGENLPFKDKEFDYVICCHVLEHVPDPVKFLQEQFRVAKKGYIEIPSLLGELLAQKESHKWIMHEHKDVLYLVDKEGIQFNPRFDTGNLFHDYLPKNSIGYKIIQRTHPNIETIRIEWESGFEFVVEPTDPEIRKFFTDAWRNTWSESFFPQRTYGQEVKETLAALWDIFKTVFRSKILKRKTY
ncbi:MAG: class I SAM-dependent methyltransferase [Lacibacter sp.]